jgi:hypothetical protein
VSAVLRAAGWVCGLGCCIGAIYFAAGAALERPDVLRIDGASASIESADYSADEQQATRPRLNPQIFGAIAVDENALNIGEGGVPGDAPSDARPPGVQRESGGPTATPSPAARSQTNTPEPTPTRTPKSEPTATNTPKPGPSATDTAEPEPTRTPTPEKKPTETNTVEPTPTKTPQHEPTSTKTPSPTKTPKPTKTPAPTRTPRPCRIPDIDKHRLGNDHRGDDWLRRHRCATPTPAPVDEG